MRFVMLTRFHSQHSQGEFVMRLAAAAADAGDSFTIVNPFDVSLNFSQAPAPSAMGSHNLVNCPVRWRDLPFPAADLVLPVARWDDEFTWQVADTLSAWGQPVFPSNRVPLGDHITMARLFAQKNIPAPRSWVINSVEQLTVILPELNFPCVMRSRSGGRGRQFVVAQHSGEALEIAARLAGTGSVMLIQDLTQPWGEDIRVVMVGNKVVTAVQRFAPPGFMRPRESGNMRVIPAHLSDEEQQVASRAAQIYGAPFCAVSLLRTPQGPLLIEVSRAPVLAEIEAATGLDLAGTIINHLQAMAATHGGNVVPMRAQKTT